MENSDSEDDGNLDNLEDLDEEQMEKLLQLQVSFKMCNVKNTQLCGPWFLFNLLTIDARNSGSDRAG